MNSNYEVLCQYFKEVDNETGGTLPSVKEGRLNFVSDLSVVGSGLDQLVKRGVIRSDLPFLDAGCGDGRVIDLMAGAYGIESIGVEVLDVNADTSEGHIQQLQKMGIFNGSIPRVLRGNFTSDDTYKRNGVEFENFGTFYNFNIQPKEIVSKIAAESPVGTIFIFTDFNFALRNPQIFDELEFVETVDIDVNYRGLDVYKKN